MRLGFWLFMLIINLLLPVIMIGFGAHFVNHPPEKINFFYGYRSKMSMKNQDTWNYAHEFSGILWYYCGWILFVLTVIIMFSIIKKTDELIEKTSTIWCVIELIPLIGAYIVTEIALRKKFDKSGNPKQ